MHGPQRGVRWWKALCDTFQPMMVNLRTHEYGEQTGLLIDVDVGMGRYGGVLVVVALDEAGLALAGRTRTGGMRVLEHWRVKNGTAASFAGSKLPGGGTLAGLAKAWFPVTAIHGLGVLDDGQPITYADMDYALQQVQCGPAVGTA